MKLFGSDYDGTFYKHKNRGENELEENKAAVEKWRSAGNLFAFATGRAINEMASARFIDGAEFDYLIGLNGGIVIDAKDAVIFRALIEPEIAEKIVKLIETHGFKRVNVTDGFKGYYASASWINDEMKALAKKHKIEKDMIESFQLTLEEALQNPVAMIAVETDNPEEANAFAAVVNETFSGQVTAFSNLQHVDISAFGLSKATGLEQLAKLHNIEHANVYGMGDSYNDVPMLEKFHGFTLPEANAEIQSFADEIYPTVGAALEDLL